MMSNVIELFPPSPPLGHYVRLGFTGHHQLESLLESGRLGNPGRLLIDRAIVNAGAAAAQTDLIRGLAERGAELILDTDVAELSSIGRFEGPVHQAPWALRERPLQLEDWEGAHGHERIAEIARFAVERGFCTVLAPTHALRDAKDRSFVGDRDVLIKLRAALDEAGGAHVGLDYPLLIPYGVLRDEQQRRAFIRGLEGLPMDALWLRVAGFGAAATPVGVRRYIAYARDFTALGRPIVADGVAGLAGLALVAFGAVGALAHGVGILERFDTSGWAIRPKERESHGGLPKRALIPDLDRQLKLTDIQAIAATTAGTRLIACSDHNCCPRGLRDMLDDPKHHYLYQRHVALGGLSRVPESRRVAHYLKQILTPADRRARMYTRLKHPNPKLKGSLLETSHRVEMLLHVLEDLSVNDSDARRAQAPILRRQRSGPATGLG